VAPLVRKSLRIMLIVTVALFVLDAVFDRDIGAWLAGLGIAGLAISLAAQDSLKNLFGSITLLLDRPFAVGDRIVYSGHDGVVEEIGLRSTKVRTLPGNLVTIPNSLIVNEPVENVGRRPVLQRILDLGVTYDTPPERVRQAVELLRSMLEEPIFAGPIHPVVAGQVKGPRVYFNDFKADSLNIRLMYWYAPPDDWWGFQEHGQRVNLRILEEFNRAGIEFAFPTQTLLLAGDPARELRVRVDRADADGREPAAQ
jgi:MscS family membrane protein